MASISIVRNELSRESTKFPIILQRVVYNGIHGGDQISVALLSSLRAELDELKSFNCFGGAPAGFEMTFDGENRTQCKTTGYATAAEANQLVQEFRKKMIELVDAAQKVNKPIVF
jgi:hypothetical protein